MILLSAATCSALAYFLTLTLLSNYEPSSKLGYVDSKLGAPTSGQQTTRILFNTIEAPGTTSTLTFFKNFQGLTNGQTNLTQNKLDSMESMVIKTIWLAQFATAGALFTFGGQVQQTYLLL
jgi:hypothetical protein